MLTIQLWQRLNLKSENILMTDHLKSGTPGSVSGEEREIQKWTRQTALTADVLRAHYLTAIDCDHAAKTDTARCFCTVWTGTPRSSVGEAVEEWIEHIFQILHNRRTGVSAISFAHEQEVRRAFAPLPAKEETPPNLPRLVEHAKDVLARGYVDLEGFARALVVLYESAPTPDEARVCWLALTRDEGKGVEYSYAHFSVLGKLQNLMGGPASGTTRCPKCGKDTPHTHDESASQSTSASEIAEALDNWEHHLADDDPSLAGEQTRAKARWCIENLFREQQRLVDTLRGEIRAMNRMFGEVCEPLHDCCQRHKLGLGGEHVQRLVVEEVDRLHAALPSSDEARALIKIIDENYSHAFTDDAEDGLAKLRSLSSRGTAE